MEPNSRMFLAGKRSLLNGSIPHLVLFGLTPHENHICNVNEYQLLKLGVSLGDFLTATITPQNTLKDFKKTPYPLGVEVEGDFAVMKFPSAKVTRNGERTLVFQTRAFGPVRSFNQNLPDGNYEIVIKANDVYTDGPVLYAEAIKTSLFPVADPIDLPNFYEVPRSQLALRLQNNQIGRSQFPNLPVPISSMNQNIPKPTSSYDYILSRSNTITSSSSSTRRHSYYNNSYLELQSCNSSKSGTLEELISKLPKLDIDEKKPPTPKPRTITPVPKTNNEMNQKIKPLLKVAPNQVEFPTPAISESPVMEKKMKAFVHSILVQSNVIMHFLWICDNMENSIFISSPSLYELGLGHFFEGIFRKQQNGQWTCIQYENKVTPLIKGNIVYGKIELTAVVSKYQPANEDIKYPHVYAKYLGTVIDRNYKLSPGCDKKGVHIQRLKLDGKQYEWIITGLA